jgi:spore coat protein CotF
VQGENGVFVMPMYPWGMGTLKLDGSYTAMLMDIRETAEMNTTTTTTTTTTQFRRLLNWMGIQ